jgi:hypothetical protein
MRVAKRVALAMHIAARQIIWSRSMRVALDRQASIKAGRP